MTIFRLENPAAGDGIEVGESALVPDTFWVAVWGLPRLTPEQAMELGTALCNAAFPLCKTSRGRAPSSNRPQVDVQEFVAGYGAKEVDTPTNTSHRVGEAGACDCPPCISMAVGCG